MPSFADRAARDLLERAPLLVLSVGPDLRVGAGGSSRLARQLLGEGEPLAGRAFAPLLLPEGEQAPERAVLEDWMRLIFEQPDRDWETMTELCPLEELTLTPPGGVERVFRLSYHPVRAGKGGPVVRLLAVGTDFTVERRLERELASRDAEGDASVRRFAEVLKLGAETFRRFVNESQMRLAEAAAAADRLSLRADDREAARTLFRQVHTLNANARAFRLEWLADAAGAVEDVLALLRDAERPGEHPSFDAVLERLEELRVLFDETEELGTTVFGRALDSGELRSRYRDLEVPVRVGRLESALALVRGTVALLSGEKPDVEGAVRLVSEIDSSLDGLRKVPATRLFQRFPKMVSDLAAIMGKRVRPLKVSGSETLVNVRALDRIGDAVVHMLRNSVAHGIERPEERARAEKAEAGTVELTLRRDGDDLVFEVADDGGGIDRESVRARGIAAGAVSAEEAAALPPEEIDRLVLRPGLSTSAAGEAGGSPSRGAGDVQAGHGVGLDIAVAAAEFLDGRIEIESRAGLGTLVRLVVPDRGPC